MAASGGIRASKARDYPPLLLAGLVMLVMLAILPSALNLPQTNPSQTLEYAPVPPEDETQVDPPAGNFSSLGLGSSSGVGGEGDTPTGLSTPGGEVPGGRAVKTAGTKKCVGSPPRQSEDPLSPPCVASFNGDNGGATYLGVNRDEVRVVLHFAGQTQECYYTRPCEPLPVDKIYDLTQPPEEGEPTRVKLYRNWMRYFNERYQTYGRFVRMFIYWGPLSGTPESRRAAAGTVLTQIKPFAALEYLSFNADAFVETIARRGVMSFGGMALRQRSVYSEFPGLIWSFAPPAEYLAETFSSFICTKAAPHPVSFSGNQGQNGRPRVFGLIRTNNQAQARYVAVGESVREKTQDCGVRYAAEATYDWCPGLNVGDGREEGAAAIIAEMQAAGVSTIIQPGCWENALTNAANAQNYYPEWLTTDYRGLERSEVGQIGQNQNVWSRAWVITPQTLQNSHGGLPVEEPCMDAYLSVDPTIDKDSFEPVIACEVYNDLRQLFTGIQVAGPRLHPKSIEKGFRAIPPKPSTGPTQPSCYYLPGEYTCVKDAVAQWWDPSAPGENQGGAAPTKGFSGCWRMGNDGKRYLPGDWPSGDILNMQRDGQICNLSNQY